MSSKKISKNLLILMALIFAMLVIPVSFASDNLTDTNTISLNQSSDASQMAIDDSGSLGDAGDKSIYVSTAGSDTEGSGSSDSPYATVGKALNEANGNQNLIFISNGTYKENNLIIKSNVNITGLGDVTIDGNKAGGIFTIAVNNLDVEFRNINFVNGKITEERHNGGVICIENNGGFVSGGTLLVNNCTFVNNTVENKFGYGGAIYNTRYDLTINNSVFVNNSAPWNGAVTNTGGNLLVLNSVFVNNVASSNVANWGGAIRSNGGILNVTKSVFINNVASKGSAIMVASSVTKANINYCIFEGYNTTIPVIESNIKTITVDANYNYFGTNVNPVNFTSGNMNLAYWTVLGVTPEVGEIIAGESVKLNIDFTKYTDGTGVYVLKEAMPALTVTLKPTIGVVNPTTVICENGIASVNYTSPVTGKEIIYINAPEQVGTLEFNVLSKEINIIYVSPNGDDSNRGTKDSPLKTLDAAIAKNHEYGGGKTIYLFDGNYIASNLNITDNVTVIGQSKMAIVDAKSKTFITTSDVSVNILNLTIKDAVNGIINNGDMAIENVLFSGNNVAILNNKKLTVEDANFINNNGAIVNTGNSIIKQSNFDNDNRAISSTAGSVTAISSKFVNNKDSGIYIENSTLSLANNVMENNNVANIYIKSGSIVSNVNVVFLNNKTVRAQNNDSIVIGAAITDDADNTITGGNITFTANGKVLGTAGIVDGIANYTITNIANGIYTISGTSSIGSNLIIKTGILNVYSASWFIGNVGYETLADAVSAAKDGDVIEGLPGIYRYSEPVEINKNIIIKNRGQGEVILDASLNKDNYIVYQIGKEYINNILRIPQRGIVVGLYNLTFINAYNQGHGGAVYNHGILSVYNCTFINNTVVGDPDYDFNYGGAAIFNYNGQLTVSDSYFVNNTGYEGGAIYAAADSDVVAILDINNTKFENNVATTVNDGGGAIYAGNYLKLIVNNTEFIANKAPTKNPKMIAGGTGGAIYIRSTIESLIENSNFVNNSAFYWGGAIKSYGAKFNITNCNFTGNYAGASGGALHFGRSSFGSDISTMINNCLFSNNDAGSIISAGGSNNRGGAICVEGIIAVYNSIFYKNTAVDGGAIYAGFVNSIIDNCTFIANSAVNGGAVNNYHNSLNISNSCFERNIASYGGAIVNYQTYGYANFLNNTYKDNSAAYGGAIYSTKGFNAYSLDVLYSEFVNNSASADGNEIYVIGNANINYNSFVNSIPVSIPDIYVDAKSVNYVSIENNWWGTSNPDWDKILSDTNVSIPKVYAVLNGTLEESGIATYDLIINMYWNGTKNQTNISNIPARLVKLNATGGSFSIDEGKFVNGVFDSEFTAKTIKQFVVIASIDNEVIKFNCTNLDTSSVNVTVTGGDSLRDTVISVVVSPNNATGNVTFNIAGKDYVIDLVNGKGNITISDLPVGEYNVNVTYNGDNNYYPSSTVAKLNITFTPKTSVNVTVNKGDDPRDNVISVIVDPKEVTGNVTVNVDGKEYIVDLVNAKANITVSNLTAGEHIINVTYNGDKNYDSSNVTVKFNETFSPIVNLTVADLEKYFGGSEKLEAVLTDCLGKAIVNGTVIFTINGKDYVKYTDKNGSAFMSINLVPGKYNITVKFNGTGLYNPMTVNSSVTVKSTVIGNDIVKMFRNGTQYSALFLDSNGNPLANATVKFNINGVFYTKITNGEGIAALNIQLLPKEYIITNYNLVTGEENSNKVTVKSLLVDNHNLVKYYLNESSYTLKVIGKDGKVAAGQEVTFNINGVFYHRVSDDNGIVSLGIKLRPGTYIVTAEYEGCWVSNNITVLPTLITKDLDMKYLDGSNFTAQTLDGQGKPLANQNVSFNVNGVFYHKTTDEKGIANLNIRLNPGKYIITSIWNEYQVGNNITIA